MVFCNVVTDDNSDILGYVTILILIDGFLQYRHYETRPNWLEVTILILIDGFLQCVKFKTFALYLFCHNPYFNRWFSAI